MAEIPPTEKEQKGFDYIESLAGFITATGERLAQIGKHQLEEMKKVHELEIRIGKLEESLLVLIADSEGVTYDQLIAQLDDRQPMTGELAIAAHESRAAGGNGKIVISGPDASHVKFNPIPASQLGQDGDAGTFTMGEDDDAEE